MVCRFEPISSNSASAFSGRGDREQPGSWRATRRGSRGSRGASFLFVTAVQRGRASFTFGASVFAVTMVLLYLASTLNHALPLSKAKRVPALLSCATMWRFFFSSLALTRRSRSACCAVAGGGRVRFQSECILNRRARHEGSITPIGQITEEAVEAIVASLQSAQGRYANHLFHKPQQRIRSANTVRKIVRPMRPFGSWLDQEGPRIGIIDELGLPLLAAAALAGNTRRSRKRQTER